MPTPTDIAWAAGFMDGEGCISIRKYKVPAAVHHTHQLDIHLSNTCEEALIKFQEVVEVGHIYPMKPKKDGKPHHKPSWQYSVNARGVEKILNLLLPYLIVKRKEAEVALEFANMPYAAYGSGGVPENVYDERERLFLKIRAVKHRFRPAPKPAKMP